MKISDEMRQWTVSNMLIVPILGIGRIKLGKYGFINSFLFNEEEEVVYENVIYLLFNPPSIEQFNQFLFEERERGVNIVQEIDYPGNYVMIVYKLPDKFKGDYALIWEGKYSQLSADYKKIIPSTIRYTKANGFTSTDKTIQHMLFDKDPVLRKFWEEELNVIMDNKQELWTLPTKEKETFKLKNYEPITRNYTGA